MQRLPALRTGVRHGHPGVGTGEAPRIDVAPGVKLVFAGRTYENFSGMGLEILDTILSPIVGVQCDVLVGMPVFRDMKAFTVDFPRAKLWVDWLPKP